MDNVPPTKARLPSWFTRRKTITLDMLSIQRDVIHKMMEPLVLIEMIDEFLSPRLLETQSA